MTTSRIKSATRTWYRGKRSSTGYRRRKGETQDPPAFEWAYGQGQTIWEDRNDTVPYSHPNYAKPRMDGSWPRAGESLKVFWRLLSKKDRERFLEDFAHLW